MKTTIQSSEDDRFPLGFDTFRKDLIRVLKDLIGVLKDLIGPMDPKRSPWDPKGAHGAQKLQGPGSRAGTAAFGPHGLLLGPMGPWALSNP